VADRTKLNRRELGRAAVVTAAAAALPAPALAAGRPAYARSHTFAEYRLPRCAETHEILRLPGRRVALISQKGPGRLVKVGFDRDERVTAIAGFRLGGAGAEPHGLGLSTRHPRLVWVTLEHDDAVLLIDPRPERIGARPRIVRRIALPPGAHGPHYVGEYGRELWISLKAGNQVLRLDPRNPRDHTVYQAPAHPIFIARHPGNGEFYASIDESSRILRISPGTGRTRLLDTAGPAGIRPVGLIPGPARSLWFALAGSPVAGTGTFARLDADDAITPFRLSSPPAADAALLHLAFESPRRGRPAALWLLSSSIVDPSALDLVIRVVFGPGYAGIAGEVVRALPTQRSKAHRLLLLPRTVMATELATSTLAQLERSAFD
jgi:virginiamycin B lyase